MKKFLGLTLCIMFVLLMFTSSVFAKEVNDGWVTTSGNGEIVKNSDGTQTFKGTTHEDNCLRGPYSKETKQVLKDGDIVNSVKVYIDPINMKAGEKIGITSLVKEPVSGNRYEYLVDYCTDGMGNVYFGTSYETGIYSTKISGLYELEIRYSKGKDGNLKANFALYRNGFCLVKSSLHDFGVVANDGMCADTFWFYDITDDDGVRVGTPTYKTTKDQNVTKYSPENWKDGNTDIVSDNVAILKGDASKVGSYANTSAKSLKNGAIIEEINVYIDPENMKEGEHFNLTTSLNDKDGNYATELQSIFTKTGNKVLVQIQNNKSHFKTEIKDAGIYTLRYRFDANEFYVFGNFEILNNGKSLAKTEPIVMDGITSKTAGARRSIWFNELDVAGGLKVYTDASADYSKVKDALAKVPADLSKYTEESVKTLNEAINSVVYGQDLLHQKDVDKYATDILAAIDNLVEFTEWTDLTPAEPVEKPDDKPAEEEKDETPKTGTTTYVTLAATLGTASVLGMYLLRKKQ